MICYQTSAASKAVAKKKSRMAMLVQLVSPQDVDASIRDNV